VFTIKAFVRRDLKLLFGELCFCGCDYLWNVSVREIKPIQHSPVKQIIFKSLGRRIESRFRFQFFNTNDMQDLSVFVTTLH